MHNAQNYSIDHSRIIQLYSLFSPLCTPLKTVLELYKCIQPTVHTTQNYSRIIQMYSAQCAQCTPLKTILELYNAIHSQPSVCTQTILEVELNKELLTLSNITNFFFSLYSIFKKFFTFKCSPFIQSLYVTFKNLGWIILGGKKSLPLPLNTPLKINLCIYS